MEQSQFYELLKTLTPAEVPMVLQFAKIQFFNQSRMQSKVVMLLEVCLDAQSDSRYERLEKQFVFAKIFPDQVFVEGKLEKVMVEAHKLVRAFLLTQHYFRPENEFQQNFDFSEIALKRGLNSRYQHLIAKIKRYQEESKVKNENYYLNQFHLEYAIHTDECFHNQKRGDLNIPNVHQALELHFHINRLALLNRFILQEKFANLSSSSFKHQVLEEQPIPFEYLQKSPTLRINSEINNLLRKEAPSESDVQTLFELLRLNEESLDEESLREFYTYLRNLCTLILNENPTFEKIHNTLHELYKDNLVRGYLHNDGQLHPSRYLAIYDNAEKVNMRDWALDFIEKYKNDIIGQNETLDIYRLTKAKYFFWVGSFEDCLDILPATSPFTDYLLIGKRLELKALFELGSDLFSYKLDAFKMFLSRTSLKLISNGQRQIHLDFANLLTQISTSIPGDKLRAERIMNRIHEKKQSAEWRWLLTKAHELKHKRPG